MRTLWLVLHIIGVAVWLGANVVQAFAGPRAAQAGAEARAWWAETQGAMARALYNVAGILVLVTGVLLVLDNDAWGFAEPFVSIGFLAIIVGIVLGVGVFGPGTRRLVAAIRGGDAGGERQLNQRMMAFGLLDSVVVVVTIVAMVGKWGA